MTSRRLSPTDAVLLRSLRADSRRQSFTDARLKLRDASQLGFAGGWFNQPTGGGGCLTATSTTYTFDPTSGGGSAGNTSRWAPLANMNLTKLQVRALNPPSGGDIDVALYDETGPSTLATVSLTDGVDTEDTWTGSAAVTTSMRLWFEAAGTVTVDLICIQAWFDNSSGGGLILYPVGGV